jgi:hypothetical protein
LWLIWFCSVSIVLGSILVLLLIARPYGVGLLWLFVSAETAIGYWRFALGTPLVIGTLGAMTCGQLDLLNWFWLADQIDYVVHYLRRKAKDLDDATNGTLDHHARRTPYVVIFVLALLPSTTVAGVAVSKVYHLRASTAFAVMSAGNLLKMAVWGLGFSGTIPLFTWFVSSFKH